MDIYLWCWLVFNKCIKIYLIILLNKHQQQDWMYRIYSIEYNINLTNHIFERQIIIICSFIANNKQILYRIDKL